MSHDELKERVDQLRRKADKAAGALSEQMKQLKKEFGCKTIEEAEKLLKKLQKEEKEQLRQLEEELENFEKEYGDVLE